jgi:hypothetical protein
MMTKRKNTKRRLALAIGAAAVIGGLAWLWSGVGDGPATSVPAAPKRSARIEAPEDTAVRQEIAAARRAAREKIEARRPATKPVMPPNPPPIGLPPSATKLPTQPDQPMPVPRGSYD